MTQRTCNIIMLCKGNHKYGDIPIAKAIAKYMAKECGCDQSRYYAAEIHNIIMTALKDYIDGVKKPSYVLWSIEEDGRFYDSIDRKICAMFSVARVRDDNGYVNGFTGELLKQSEIDLG